MIESFIHASEKNNLYLYDDSHRLSMLIHPEFMKAYEKSLDSDPYYLKKYAYLSKHGFFEKNKIADFRKLEEAEVLDNITNIRQIVFEVIDSCNLNCRYCAFGDFYDGYDERISKKINTRYAIKLLKYIFNLLPRNKNHKLYIGFYGGEALLNINFIKRIIDVAKELNIDKEMEIVYSMTTNATLLHKYMDFLVMHKFNILVSLDGGENNHSYRVFLKNDKNSFHKVIENVDLLQNKYPEYFLTHVNFNAVLHNKNSVKEINEFIIKKYKKIPRISELEMRDVRKEKKDILKDMFQSKRESDRKFLDEESELTIISHHELSIYKELTSFLKFISINYYVSNLNALLQINDSKLPTSTCTPFFKKIFLTNRNKLLMCEKINYKYSMGKVDEKIEIDIPSITQQYNFYYAHIKKYCQSCYAYRFCGACLFQLDNLDIIDSEEFVCEMYQDQKTYQNKMFRIISFLEKYPNDFSQIVKNVIFE